MNFWIALISECEGCGETVAIRHDVKRGDRIKCVICGTIAKVGSITQECKPEKKKTFDAEPVSEIG
jgi:hypothetical protein